MSIPDRFYRIARHKLGEVREWFDKVDEEEDIETERDRRVNQRADARRELNDGLATGTTAPTPAREQPAGTLPFNAPRTPQEIARNARNVAPANLSQYNPSPSMNNSLPPAGTPGGSVQADPLDYHYKLLGLEPGTDWAGVQEAYKRLAARTDPSRFPAGSSDAQAAQQIRQKLDASFKQLREALDLTSGRINRLEF